MEGRKGMEDRRWKMEDGKGEKGWRICRRSKIEDGIVE
jgi:hypothetical protein